MAGAPKGNKNATRGTEWRDAIRRAVAMYDEAAEEESGGVVVRGQALYRIAVGVVRQALAGNKDAIQEIGNRLDGRPHQSIDIGLSANTPVEEFSDVELSSELERVRALIGGESDQATSQEEPTNVH